MKCSFCGHELEPGSGFCPECGTMMSLDEADAPEAISAAQKYEPDSEDAYSEQVTEDSVQETQAVEEEWTAPEYVPNTQTAFEDYNTIRQNEELAFEAKAAEEEEDDPFAELHPDAQPISFVSEKASESSDGDDEDDGDDMYLDSKKSKKGGVTIAVLVVVLVVALVVGVSAVKNNGGDILSVFKRETTTSDEKTTDSAGESSAKESSSAEKSTQKTTEKESKKTTDKNVSKTEKNTSDAQTSTTGEKTTSASQSTTKPAAESSSSRPASSSESTTKPYTTTTKPYSAPVTASTNSYTTTTRPASTTFAPKPTTETLQKPSSYYSSPVVRYASVDGVSVRLRPSSSSTVASSLSIGGEVKVYAEENGYCYVYYPRYGVNGWVSSKYLAKQRPVAESEVKVSGVVEPDKLYSSPVTKTVNTADGLRLRKGPGTNYDTIRYLGEGYPVLVKGKSSKVSGWVYVTDITRGVSGWVSAEYIK